ncbi:unnamed protein product [Amoebophrya sp. A120]|nr:unnamed protein product [Amoebophrya sp. A120]|eukprot:GSA120T00014595001.1
MRQHQHNIKVEQTAPRSVWQQTAVRVLSAAWGCAKTKLERHINPTVILFLRELWVWLLQCPALKMCDKRGGPQQHDKATPRKLGRRSMKIDLFKQRLGTGFTAERDRCSTSNTGLAGGAGEGICNAAGQSTSSNEKTMLSPSSSLTFSRGGTTSTSNNPEHIKATVSNLIQQHLRQTIFENRPYADQEQLNEDFVVEKVAESILFTLENSAMLLADAAAEKQREQEEHYARSSSYDYYKNHSNSSSYYYGSYGSSAATNSSSYYGLGTSSGSTSTYGYNNTYYTNTATATPSTSSQLQDQQDNKLQIKLLQRIAKQLLQKTRELGSLAVYATLPYECEVQSDLVADYALPKKAVLWPRTGYSKNLHAGASSSTSGETRNQQQPRGQKVTQPDIMYSFHCPCCYRPQNLKMWHLNGEWDEDFSREPSNNSCEDENEQHLQPHDKATAEQEDQKNSQLFLGAFAAEQSARFWNEHDPMYFHSRVCYEETETAKPLQELVKQQLLLTTTDKSSFDVMEENDHHYGSSWSTSDEHKTSSPTSSAAEIQIIDFEEVLKVRSIIGEEDETWNFRYTSDRTRENWSGNMEPAPPSSGDSYEEDHVAGGPQDYNLDTTTVSPANNAIESCNSSSSRTSSEMNPSCSSQGDESQTGNPGESRRDDAVVLGGGPRETSPPETTTLPAVDLQVGLQPAGAAPLAGHAPVVEKSNLNEGMVMEEDEQMRGNQDGVNNFSGRTTSWSRGYSENWGGQEVNEKNPPENDCVWSRNGDEVDPAQERKSSTLSSSSEGNITTTSEDDCTQISALVTAKEDGQEEGSKNITSEDDDDEVAEVGQQDKNETNGDGRTSAEQLHQPREIKERAAEDVVEAVTPTLLEDGKLVNIDAILKSKTAPVAAPTSTGAPRSSTSGKDGNEEQQENRYNYYDQKMNYDGFYSSSSSAFKNSSFSAQWTEEEWQTWKNNKDKEEELADAKIKRQELLDEQAQREKIKTQLFQTHPRIQAIVEANRCNGELQVDHEHQQGSSYFQDPHIKKCAFVIFLWGESIEYVLGACVLGKSLLETDTKHDLLCLHTKDVTELKTLEKFWKCKEINHIEATDKGLFNGWKDQNRFCYVFTKLHALNQTEYEKVLVLDIDMCIRRNIDCLFDLPCPAAMQRGANNNCKYAHGQSLNGANFFRKGLSGPEAPKENEQWPEAFFQGTGINAGVMLFQPDAKRFQDVCTVVKTTRHPEHINTTAPEQDFLSRYFADYPWHNISVRFNFQLHQIFHNMNPLNCAERKRYLDPIGRLRIAVVHYSGTLKPWHHVCDPEHHDSSIESFVEKCLNEFETYKHWHLKNFDSVGIEEFEKEAGIKCEFEEEFYDQDNYRASSSKVLKHMYDKEEYDLWLKTDGDEECRSSSKPEPIDMDRLNHQCKQAMEIVRESHVFWLYMWKKMWDEDFNMLERCVFRKNHMKKDAVSGKIKYVPWADWDLIRELEKQEGPL